MKESDLNQTEKCVDLKLILNNHLQQNKFDLYIEIELVF